MNPLVVVGYAAAGDGSEVLPEARRVELPGPGTKRRGGRLPLLATALARAALGERELESSSAVLFGSSLGCLTETEVFVSNMIERAEETPKPRAFSASVHNAIASRVALDLEARGECQTFVQGEVSFAQALFAATAPALVASAPLSLVGALDEVAPARFATLASLQSEPPVQEGGAVFALQSMTAERTGLCRIEQVELVRAELDAYRSACVERWRPDVVLAAEQGAPEHGLAALRHGSALAVRVAQAVAWLCGERVNAADRPASILVCGTSAFGDAAAVLLRGV